MLTIGAIDVRGRAKMPRVRCVKFSSLLSLVLVASSLVGCGDDGGSSRLDAAVGNADAPIADTAVNMTTALTAMINSTQTLDTAYYGVNANGTLYVEAYKGADPGCPTSSSGQPDYTLILGSFPAMSAASATSTANLFDFVGDLHDSFPAPLMATAVSLTAITYVVDSHVELTADLTFDGGTVAGHLYATHCTSLDD